MSVLPQLPIWGPKQWPQASLRTVAANDAGWPFATYMKLRRVSHVFLRIFLESAVYRLQQGVAQNPDGHHFAPEEFNPTDPERDARRCRPGDKVAADYGRDGAYLQTHSHEPTPSKPPPCHKPGQGRGHEVRHRAADDVHNPYRAGHPVADERSEGDSDYRRPPE